MKLRWILLAAIVSSITLGGARPGWADPGLAGSWQLDIDASTFGPLPAPAAQHDTIEWTPERLSLVRTTSLPGGRESRSRFDLPLDGRRDAVIAGDMPATGTARMEGNTLVLVIEASMPAGRVIVTDRCTVDPSTRSLLAERSVEVAGQPPMRQRLVYRSSDGTETPPTPEALLRQMVEALGGEATVRRVTSIRQRGTVGASAEGSPTAAMEIRWQAPDLLVIHTDVPGYGRVSQGHDGTNAWRAAPGSATQVLSGKDARGIIAMADFRGPLTYRERFDTASVDGPVTFEGMDCWRLVLEDDDGDRVTFFVDREAHLIRGQQQAGAADIGADVIGIYEDYATVDGRTLVVRWRVRFGDQEQHFDLSDVSFDPHPDGTFVRPE